MMLASSKKRFGAAASKLMGAFEMVWFFERGEQSLKWEVRRGSDAYEIATERSDATLEVRAFKTPAELLAEIDTIPQALLREGWRARNQDLVMLAAPLARHA